MKRLTALRAASLGACVACCAVSTEITAGNPSIQGQTVIGELGFNTVNIDPFDDANFLSTIQDTGAVGAGVEIVLVDPQLTGDFSITGGTLTVDASISAGALPFNGLRFELTDTLAPEILDASLVGSTYPGFDASRLFFQDRRVALHFGGLAGAGTIMIDLLYEPPACPWDFDGSTSVDFQDLLSLLAAWGPCAGCPQDLDGDDEVGFQDLLAMLANWGPCP